MKIYFITFCCLAVAKGTSLNHLLYTDIFPSFPVHATVGERNDKSSVISELKSLLADGALKQKIYSKYLKTYKKSSIRLNDVDHLSVFEKNLVDIAEHNLEYVAGNSSWAKGVNQFTDMTQAEITAGYTGYRVELGANLSTSSFPRKLPGHLRRNGRPHVDWRGDGVVTSVRDQKQCGSCVFFSTTAALESSHALWHNKQKLDLSEQELVDCARGNGNNGCDGGTFFPTFDYLKDKGLTSEDRYRYEGRNGPCRSSGKPRSARVTAWAAVKTQGNENVLKEILASYGPVAVAFHVNDDFAKYKTGVFDKPCQGGTNHALLLVGYGWDSKERKDYWIVKNSWGVGFGEGGYIRLRRNYGNLCGIAGDALILNA